MTKYLLVFFLVGCSSYSDNRELLCKAECEKCEKVTLECKEISERKIIEVG